MVAEPRIRPAAIGDDGVAGFVRTNTHRDSPSCQGPLDTRALNREDLRGHGLGEAWYRHLHARLAKLGKWRDVAWRQKQLQEPSPTPVVPRV